MLIYLIILDLSLLPIGLSYAAHCLTPIHHKLPLYPPKASMVIKFIENAEQLTQTLWCTDAKYDRYFRNIC